jgi:hypothetical protein
VEDTKIPEGPPPDATPLDGHKPGSETVLDDSIEALVRTAHEELTQMEDSHADSWEAPDSAPSAEGQFAVQPPANVVSWADIEAYAEAATDIGPQVRSELARYHLPRPDRDLPITPLPSPRRWPGRIMVAAGLGAFLVLGVLRLIHGLSVGGPAHGPAVVASGAPPASPPISSHRSAARGPRRSGLTAWLHVTSRCWLRVTADGRVIQQETVPAGQFITLHAKKRLELELGNAGGVALRVNGKMMRTGGPGQVVHLAFTWHHGHVIGG